MAFQHGYAGELLNLRRSMSSHSMSRRFIALALEIMIWRSTATLFSLLNIFRVRLFLFWQGGRGDRESLRITLLRVWPTVSGADLTNTETWALSEDLRILTAERKALNILAKNMLETKQIGCLVVELERALAELSTECS